MKIPKILNLDEVSKDTREVLYDIFMSSKFLDEVGKPGIGGMNLDGVKHTPQHPPMPGISTKRYRNIKRRMLDRIRDNVLGAMNQIDTVSVPPPSRRCRLKDCKLKDKRQKDAKFCRDCGNELKD